MHVAPIAHLLAVGSSRDVRRVHRTLLLPVETTNLPETIERMSADIEIAIFRVVQECLRNVHHNSSSSTATVRIERTPDLVCVVVEDSGNGIPRGADGGYVKPGIGIRGMHERLGLLGGNLQIDSNEKGTRVQATLPVQPRPTTDRAVIRPSRPDDGDAASDLCR